MYQWIVRNIAEGMIAADFRISSALGNGDLDENSPILLLKQESPVLYVTALLNGSTTDLEAHKNFMANYLEHLKQNLSDYFCKNIVCLTIIVDNQAVDNIVNFVDNQIFLPGESIYHVWWYAIADEQKIYTGNDQPNKILNIQTIVLEALKNPVARDDIPLRRLEKTVLDKTTPKAKTNNLMLTLTLFLINALVLATMILNGNEDEWIRVFGCSTFEIIQNHQYYRLFTSMFLHGGIMHLLSNSLYLYFFGSRVEILFGKVKMLSIYIFSGLVGNVFSIIFTKGTSVGASGALFGLMGTILLFSRKKGQRWVGMNYTSLLLWVVVAILIGFLQTGVNSFAHIGGFLGGMVLSYFFLQISEKNE